MHAILIQNSIGDLQRQRRARGMYRQIVESITTKFRILQRVLRESISVQLEQVRPRHYTVDAKVIPSVCEGGMETFPVASFKSEE